MQPLNYFTVYKKQIEWVRITKEISIWGARASLALDMYLLYIWIALPSSNEILYILIPVSSGPVDVHCYKKMVNTFVINFVLTCENGPSSSSKASDFRIINGPYLSSNTSHIRITDKKNF
jgi:hypothetical protein